MTPQQLQTFQGASVLMNVNGQQALGILNFIDGGEPVLTTLCFVDKGQECPVLHHRVTSEEVQNMQPDGRNRLVSTICLQIGSRATED